MSRWKEWVKQPKGALPGGIGGGYVRASRYRMRERQDRDHDG